MFTPALEMNCGAISALGAVRGARVRPPRCTSTARTVRHLINHPTLVIFLGNISSTDAKISVFVYKHIDAPEFSPFNKQAVVNSEITFPVSYLCRFVVSSVVFYTV